MPNSNPSSTPFVWINVIGAMGAGATLVPRDENDPYRITAGTGVPDGEDDCQPCPITAGWEITSVADSEPEARREVEVAIAAVEAHRAGAPTLTDAFLDVFIEATTGVQVGGPWIDAKLVADLRRRYRAAFEKITPTAKPPPTPQELPPADPTPTTPHTSPARSLFTQRESAVWAAAYASAFVTDVARGFVDAHAFGRRVDANGAISIADLAVWRLRQAIAREEAEPDAVSWIGVALDPDAMKRYG